MSGSKVAGKGALAGLVAGGAQAFVWADSVRDHPDSLHGIALLATPFVIGGLASLMIRLRRLPLVTLAGGLATTALGQALWRVAPDHTSYGFDRSALAVVPLLAAVAGFAVAAWAVDPAGRWRPGIAVFAVLGVVCVLAIPLEGPARRWHRARGFELLGVPLVAPEISGHMLYAVEAPIVGGRFEPAEPVITLDYRRVGSGLRDGASPGVQVLVRRPSSATVATGCPVPYHAEYWKKGGACRAAPGGLWVRRGPRGELAVFAHRAGALMELHGLGVPEAELLAGAETVRPIAAETLAGRVPPVR
ncbi:hypothetical protein [Sphaerisporangium sp. TRM90804]|uniref:hypothetical protein n=1 Tax=Sphaerisporangium sp. TRM90804 TaxID=3031113 RepID=UPI0024468F3F|nr:hypothetical protein [Sphaerisporangium sp. TRM90804]MDH2426006.1 hypothetical protein [Sphaerisporangium sp. TRM90804]